MTTTFGDYGGRYVPETLIPALDELDAPAGRQARRRRVPRRAATASCDVRGPADAADARRAVRARQAASTSSARTSSTRARTSSTTRSARRCSRGGSASSGSSPRRAPASTASRPRRSCARFGLECVVYMGAEDMRRQQPNVERMGLLGAEVRAGRVRHEDAEGGDERGDPRLDHERRDDALPDRLLRRPAPLSGDRARAAARDRRRSRGSRSSPPRGGCPRSSSPASAAARTRSACSPASSTTPRCGSSASRRRCGERSAPAAPGVLHGARSSILADEDGQISTRTRSRPASTTRASAPSTPRFGTSGRVEYVSATDEEALAAFQRLARDRGDHPGARARARARAGRRARRGPRPRLPVRARRQGSRPGPRRTRPAVSGKTLVVYLMAGRRRRSWPRRRSTAAPTSSRSASPSPTRSPTGR